jgi:short-subunit dehydrogenase
MGGTKGVKNFRGKKALVTGAGSGIGLCIALELSRLGADVFLVDVDEARLRDALGQVRANRVEAIPRRCDLSQPAQVSHCVQEVLRCWGTLDILVNNAGVAYYGPTERMTSGQWDWLLQVNLHTPIQLTREFLPTLLQRPEAHILNVCSIAGLVAGPRLTAYHVSKFGLVGFSESLRAEYANRGLGVTALCPGLVRTGLFRAAASGHPDKPVKQPPRWLSVSPESVARKAVRAIRRNRGLVLVSAMAHMLWFLRRLSPGLLDRVNRFQRKRWRGTRSTASRKNLVMTACGGAASYPPVDVSDTRPAA